MSVQELYEELQESYQDVFERIGNEKWIAKYLKKFTVNSLDKELKAGMAAEDWEKIFKATHSLKGLALNMGFNRLATVSAKVCEATREGAPAYDITADCRQILLEYDRIAGLIPAIE